MTNDEDHMLESTVINTVDTPRHAKPRIRRRYIAKKVFLFPEMGTGPENPWLTDRGKATGRWRKATGLGALEVCAGGGGQALGFEQAGVEHVGLLEIDSHACETLRLNRPKWNVLQRNLNDFDGAAFKGVDIVCGGLPCPPFSVAGKQLGKKDERNLFPAAIRLVDEMRPRAVMIENVRGILGAVFADYRGYIASQLKKLGYESGWQLVNASDFGVSQVRPRAVFVAIRKERADGFDWPARHKKKPLTVGACLYDLMS